MLIRKLWLKDFRSYEQLETSFADGTCVVLGPNGVGKSNLIEAICYAGQLESFRMAHTPLAAASSTKGTAMVKWFASTTVTA